MATTFYTALFTAGGELTGAGYARKSANFTIVAGRTANAAALTWGPLTVGWGTVIGIKLFAAATGGDPLYSAATTQGVATQAGYRYRINAGGIVFPEGILDTALFDEALFDQLELGAGLPPVALNEITVPPPSPGAFRVMDWARRPM